MKQIIRKRIKYMIFKSLKQQDIWEEKFITIICHQMMLLNNKQD